MAKRVMPTEPPIQNGHMNAKLLGEIIRSKRTSTGLTIQDAAMLCNVSLATMSKIETASKGVMLDKVLQVCENLGIKIYAEINELDKQ
jgi:transcriptional regulator with XRE-family HTH domain